MVARSGWLLGLVLLALPALAANLAGSFSTSFTLGDSLALRNQLALRFTLSTFELHSLSTWQGWELARQAFTLSGTLGNVGLQAGVVLQPVGAPRLGPWIAREFQVVASFLTLELKLGNLRLSLTLQAGPAEP